MCATQEHEKPHVFAQTRESWDPLKRVAFQDPKFVIRTLDSNKAIVSGQSQCKFRGLVFNTPIL